ncbi:MAG: hypothetical protein JWN83_821 [Chitinophagaceae bacterium]|nr:hypothetical protein [Chitinophagaceae bacterium]
MQQESFHLVIDGVPYIVKVIPFDFNGEMRFRVSYNEGPEHIFTWNSELGRVAAIDDDSAIIPDSVEQAIAAKLQALAE